MMCPRRVSYQGVDVNIDYEDRVYLPAPFGALLLTSYRQRVSRLTLCARHVFDALLEKTRTQNFAFLTRSQLSTMTGHSLSSVSRALTLLQHEGLIYKHRNDAWEVDPEVFWFGGAKTYWRHEIEPTTDTHDKLEVRQDGEHIVDMHYPKPEHVRAIQDAQARKSRGAR